MTFDKFIGEVQHRARLASFGDAVRAAEATLKTLAERLSAEETKDLASQLPREISHYLQVDEHSIRMSLDDFFKKISERDRSDLPKAIYHARVVIEILQEAVSKGEIDDVRAQLPPEWAPLFDTGSQGDMNLKETIKSVDHL